MNKSFLKWAGSKIQLINEIKSHIPHSTNKFVEVFSGSAVMSLNIDVPNLHINDINSDLIDTFNFILDKKETFISDCKCLFNMQNNNKEKFLELRKKFNTTSSSYEKSLLFIYLNRHCFNGLCRYNKSKGFNVPFGKYKNPYFPEKELRFFSQQNIKTTSINFDKIFTTYNSPDTVLYCDPPYVPISESASFTTYWEPFGMDKQEHLADLVKNSKCKVILSNSCCDKTKNLYKGLNIHEVNVIRKISSKKETRGTIKEIIVKNF
jgi:DNA adenine methylase